MKLRHQLLQNGTINNSISFINEKNEIIIIKTYKQQMKKVLAILAVNPDYVEFAIPELKSLLSKLPIPFTTLFSESMPLPDKNYQISHKVIKNFPYVTLTVPNFDQHRDCKCLSLFRFLACQ